MRRIAGRETDAENRGADGTSLLFPDQLLVKFAEGKFSDGTGNIANLLVMESGVAKLTFSDRSESAPNHSSLILTEAVSRLRVHLLPCEGNLAEIGEGIQGGGIVSRESSRHQPGDWSAACRGDNPFASCCTT
jgi:hypothetical protein